jgi:hypothetical protein
LVGLAGHQKLDSLCRYEPSFNERIFAIVEPAFDCKMQMWPKCKAGATTIGDQLAFTNLSLFHNNSMLLQVPIAAEASVAVLNDNIVGLPFTGK